MRTVAFSLVSCVTDVWIPVAGKFEKGSGNTWSEAEGSAERVSCSLSSGCGRVGCSCHPISRLRVLCPAALGPLLGGVIVQGNVSLL